ncbi:MAG: hypothetical protein FKY71_10135 [Spiribacter salinus]|uniref:Uncharacterized protein n=1 Tax=Spiribacter salinus TaxID=1335746 RepID=A0A540VR50_9GAMM|nr:MAG: hypothetical protein FKY71_10135 [Spiribacter salinus]
MIIAASGLNRVTSLLAFLLPLKVILLVASDGVSRWFEPFVGPEGKDSLVIALTVAAIVSFFLSIALDALTDRLSASASHTLLQGSNELAVVGNQGTTAQNIYSQFSDTAAGTLFVLAGLSVIAWVNPLLLGALLGLSAAEFLFTALVIARTNPINPGPIARLLTQDLRDYLNIFSSINFLAAFGILLYPFVWGGGGQVLAALVSIVVLRRILGVSAEVIQNAVKMVQRRAVIDALVFREEPYRGKERDVMRILREIFQKQARESRARQSLRSAGIPFEEVEATWQDSRLSGMNRLAIRVRTGNGMTRFFQQQIYMPKHDLRLENEAVLFEYMSREQLRAPGQLLRFNEGVFQCQICESGVEEAVGENAWREVRNGLLERLMCVQPPRSLVEAFTMSRPLLHDRLSGDLIDRLEIGVDTADERSTIDELRARLALLRERIRAIPLYVRNPEIQYSNVVLDEDGEPIVMTWGKWTLEPLGAALPSGIKRGGLEKFVRSISRTRSDVPVDFAVEHMELAGTAYECERLIHDNLLKGALDCAARLLANPLLATADTQHGGLIQ